MDGKRILIVDDVIPTGGSLHALETLAAKSTGTKSVAAQHFAEATLPSAPTSSSWSRCRSSCTSNETKARLVWSRFCRG